MPKSIVQPFLKSTEIRYNSISKHIKKVEISKTLNKLAGPDSLEEWLGNGSSFEFNIT